MSRRTTPKGCVQATPMPAHGSGESCLPPHAWKGKRTGCEVRNETPNSSVGGLIDQDWQGRGRDRAVADGARACPPSMISMLHAHLMNNGLGSMQVPLHLHHSSMQMSDI